MSGFSRFSEIMDTEEETDEGKTELTSLSGELHFEGVSFGYNDGGEAAARIESIVSNARHALGDGDCSALFVGV